MFIAVLIPHIMAGLTALSSGAVVIVSRKGTAWHVRAGTTYFWAIAALAATAAGLTAVRGVRDLPVLGLGLLALALAAAGRHARCHPGARPWGPWPGHGPHILAMTSSYTVTWTAFLSDNARFLPLTSQLPAVASMLLPAGIALPLVAGALRRSQRPRRSLRSSRRPGRPRPGAQPKAERQPGASEPTAATDGGKRSHARTEAEIQILLSVDSPRR